MSPGDIPSRYLSLATFAVVAVFFLLLGYNHSPQIARQSKGVLRHASRPDDSFSDILNSTLGFQKIFVINLDSRPDRRDTMALAAHFTGLQVEFVDGVTKIDDKALPIHDSEFDPPRGFLLARRAHLNVVRTIIEQNLTSALILEDDSDWDMRIKSQMQAFASASRVLLQPRLPAAADRQYWDASVPRTSQDQQPQDYDPTTHRTVTPTTSPYGDVDRWDMLWLGHCGTRFPRASEDGAVPLGRVVLADDETVPERQHVGMQFGNDELVQQYPAHTRVVHRVAGSACPLAYALSLPGARRVLHELGSNMTEVLDFELTWLCEGKGPANRPRSCLTVQPQLFQHHRAVGPKNAQSDISDHPGREYRHVPFSRNIRYSTRVNLPALVDGDTGYVDSFPDGAEAADLGY